ncbi:MAG: hypothetical protein J0M02_01795 [Planctomycetes bacterium]|nr:hypothetical protein [Planctomycetota bacterium]
MPKPRASRSTARHARQVPRAHSSANRSVGTRSIAARPLATVLIDCTICDTVVVHPATGAPIGRPWITVAIDTGSRMVTGLHLSLDQPSATSVDRCIRHSISRKAAYLARLGISGTWPVQGPMAAVAIDLPLVSQGAALTATLTKHHIRLIRRGSGTQAFRGISETVIRQLGPVLHSWPSPTRTHPAHPDSSARAVLTLRDLEHVLVDFIVNVYHLDYRVELGMPPMHAWTAATARLPASPTAS